MMQIILSSGSRIGPYEILSRAGAGGMGEVWKARDTRLGRTVAIKISDSRFSDRFERETKAIAALNHPHISALYDVGADYLVMEFIEGEPIHGPLPLDKALEYGKQVLEALHAAHRAGIVHRDLKPANILVTKSGVKVLDFGLAKIEHAAVASGIGNTITLARAITQEGAIAGTLQYMAPEQLQGGAVDSRADLFAFGCVLYEMLTGKRAFDGTSAASVIAAILERPAPSIGDVAPSVDRVLKRCLAKDPEERWQDALDIRAELEWIGNSPDATAPLSKTRPRTWLWMTVIAALAVALATVSFIHFREKPAELPLLRASIVAPEEAKFSPQTGPLEITPDGKRIACVSQSGGTARIWTRSLDSTTASVLPGTDGASRLFWSRTKDLWDSGQTESSRLSMYPGALR